VSETVVREMVEKREVVVVAGREVVLAPLCTFKFQEACRLLAEMIEKFGIGEILESIGGLGENATATQAGLTLAPLLPKILKELPDAVRRFVAVCCIPDKELMELYGTPNGIAERVEEVERELLFTGKPSELTRAFGKFLGCLEIEDLKNEVSGVATTFQSLMGQSPSPRKRRG